MQPNNPGAAMFQFLPIIFIFLVFYLIIIRPQQSEQKKRQVMINNLKKNDEIVTLGGIFGTIVNIKDKTFVIRIDDNAKMEIEKNSVAYVCKSSQG